MQVLIVEHGSNRGSLAAARSLSRAGWTVDVLGSGHSVTSRSRSVRTRTPVDWPACGEEGLVSAVGEAVRRHGSELVLPVDETQLLTLSRHRERLGARLPFAAHEVLERATDRLELAHAAEAAGLAPPRTTAAGEDPGSPEVVVKARRPKLHSDGGGWARFETWIGPTAEAATAVAAIEAAGGEAVLQERVYGRLTSTTVLTGPDGGLIAQMQQEAERIWPQDAGTSARARTVPIDAEHSRRVLALLGALGWHGLAQLQFLVDAAGTHRLIDFNPRFYGSLSLAIGAGADFPALWAASATGQPLPPTANGRPGVRYQWFGGDMRRALRERRGGIARDAAETLGWGTRAVRPVWSARDPLPALESGLRGVRGRLGGRR